MTILQQIITLTFTPIAIIAVLAFLLRKFFEQLLSRDAERHRSELEKTLESHKAKLTQEYETSRLRLDNELQKQFYQYQTKFSIFHQKQVEVVSELYGMIVETRDKVEDLVSPMVHEGDKSNEEKYHDTGTTFNSFSNFYRKNRIYVNEDACQKIDSILDIMRTSIIKHRNLHGAPGYDKEWLTAWKAIREEVEPLLSDLEKQLRQSLSEVVDTGNILRD